jgi:hypothetical protein
MVLMFIFLNITMYSINAYLLVESVFFDVPRVVPQVITRE